MSAKKISQRAAQRMKKRVRELESINAKQTAAWPEGAIVASVAVTADGPAHVALTTSRVLGFAVSAVARAGTIWFYAMPIQEHR